GASSALSFPGASPLFPTSSSCAGTASLLGGSKAIGFWADVGFTGVGATAVAGVVGSFRAGVPRPAGVPGRVRLGRAGTGAAWGCLGDTNARWRSGGIATPATIDDDDGFRGAA